MVEIIIKSELLYFILAVTYSCCKIGRIQNKIGKMVFLLVEKTLEIISIMYQVDFRAQWPKSAANIVEIEKINFVQNCCKFGRNEKKI